MPWRGSALAAHLAEPAVPDLLQVEQALPPQVRRFEELHCNRAHPAAHALSCPPARHSPTQPALPASPGQAMVSPGPAPRRGAPEQPPQQPSAGTQQPEHPPAQASPHSRAGGQCRVPVSPDGVAAESWLPAPSPPQGPAQPELWHLAPSWLPLSWSRSCPPGHPCQGRAAMGPLLGCAPPAPPHCCHSPAPRWAGGAAAGCPPHSSPTQRLVYTGLGLMGGTVWGAHVPAQPRGV